MNLIVWYAGLALGEIGQEIKRSAHCGGRGRCVGGGNLAGTPVLTTYHWPLLSSNHAGAMAVARRPAPRMVTAWSIGMLSGATAPGRAGGIIWAGRELGAANVIERKASGLAGGLVAVVRWHSHAAAAPRRTGRLRVFVFLLIEMHNVRFDTACLFYR